MTHGQFDSSAHPRASDGTFTHKLRAEADASEINLDTATMPGIEPPLTDALLQDAEDAYDRADQGWFEARSTEELVAMWAICCDINRGASWDDEVFDALSARGHFDRPDPEATPDGYRDFTRWEMYTDAGNAAIRDAYLTVRAAAENDDLDRDQVIDTAIEAWDELAKTHTEANDTEPRGHFLAALNQVLKARGDSTAPFWPIPRRRSQAATAAVPHKPSSSAGDGREEAARAAAASDSAFSGSGWGRHRPVDTATSPNDMTQGDLVAFERAGSQRNLARVVEITDDGWGDPPRVWLEFVDPNDPSQPRTPRAPRFDADFSPRSMDRYFRTTD